MSKPRTSIQECAAIIHRGGLVLYPTEGVWGLGCDPRNEAAVTRLLELKQRDVAKGLILISGDSAHMDAWVDWLAMDALQRTEVMETWPGFHTWVLPSTVETPYWIRGDHLGVAVRVSQHPTVVALCDAVGSAVVSTSANVASEPSPRSLSEVSSVIVHGVDAIAEGETGGENGASPITDISTGALLRE